jgi:hypothetical protein
VASKDVYDEKADELEMRAEETFVRTFSPKRPQDSRKFRYAQQQKSQ